MNFYKYKKEYENPFDKFFYLIVNQFYLFLKF